MQSLKNNKNVLVVEDDKGIAELISLVCQKCGYGFYICDNGRSAEALVKKLRPDAVLMDFRLPGLDGAKLTKKIKAGRKKSTIPVILISAQNDLPALAKNCGADGFLAKPFELDKLVKILNNLLKH